MSFWIYVAILSVVAIAIASRMDTVTNEELNEDPWKK